MIALDGNAIWAVNYQDRTLTRVDRRGRAEGDRRSRRLGDRSRGRSRLRMDAQLLRRKTLAPGPVHRRVNAIVPVGLDPTALTAGDAVYVTNETAGTLLRIEPETLRSVILRHRLAGPAGVVTDGRSVWVAESFGQRVLQLDARTGETLRSIKLSLAPDALALSGNVL
jgi:hypothetical protein